MAYRLSNKCAKNLCKRAVLVQLIIGNVVTFFWTQCTLDPLPLGLPTVHTSTGYSVVSLSIGHPRYGSVCHLHVPCEKSLSVNSLELKTYLFERLQTQSGATMTFYCDTGAAFRLQSQTPCISAMWLI